MHTLLFHGRDELIKLTSNDIVFIEADGNYARAMLTSEKEQLLSMNLSKVHLLLENQLGIYAGHFERVGRDLIIRKSYIYSIQTLKKKLILKVPDSDKYYELEVSKEALKKLKESQELKLQQPLNIHLRDCKTQQVYSLQTGDNIFGRISSTVICTHPINNGDTKISRKHFNIILTQLPCDDQYQIMIIDMNSANGTFVDGNIIMPSKALEVRVDSCIKAGNSEFILEMVGNEKTEIDVV